MLVGREECWSEFSNDQEMKMGMECLLIMFVIYWINAGKALDVDGSEYLKVE